MKEESNFTNTSIDDDLYDHQSYPNIPESLVIIIQIMDDYILPVVILLGILGNTLSLIVYVSTPRLCRQTSSVYLAFLSGVDNAYLLFYCMIWFNFIGINIYHQNGWCQTIFYSMYVCNFLAAWTVVSFTGDRWIIVFRPLQRRRLCTRRRAFKNMVILTMLGLFLYSYSLLTVFVDDQYPDMPVCMESIKNENLSFVIKASNIIITILIPLVVIVTMNASIAIKISKYNRKIEVKPSQLLTMGGLSSIFTYSNAHHKSRSPHKEKFNTSKDKSSIERQSGYSLMMKYFSKQLPSSTNGIPSNSSMTSQPPIALQSSNLHPFNQHCVSEQKIEVNCTNQGLFSNPSTSKSHANKKTDYKTNKVNNSVNIFPLSTNQERHTNLRMKTKRHHTQLHITRSLLLVSTVFLLLNLPSYAFHLCGLVMSFSRTSLSWDDNSYSFLWDHFVQFVYCSNFSSRFFLYIGCSQHFRYALKKMACIFKAGKRRSDGSKRRRWIRKNDDDDDVEK